MSSPVDSATEVVQEEVSELLKQADKLADQATYQESFGIAVSQGLKDVTMVFFTDNIDFMTKFQIVLCMISFGLLVTYLAMPMTFRRKIEALDYDAQAGGFISTSGIVALGNLSMLLLSKLQKMSMSKDHEQKLDEGPIAREFRLR